MRRLAIAIVFLAALVAAASWFHADEPLDPATLAWLEPSRTDQNIEGLDYLILMGAMAPANADPIEHARELLRRKEADFDLQIDYLSELMQGSPCEIDDWACWDSDQTPWVTDTLANYAHVLERWYSLPVHHDFDEEPIRRWLFGLMIPALELLGNLMTLQLVDAKRNQDLDELALQMLEQATQLSAARPVDGKSISLVVFELIRQRAIKQMLLAVRFGAASPPPERLDQLLTHQMSLGDQLLAWAQYEFDQLEYAYPFLHRDFPDNLLARENRTLNRARACLEQVIELADPARLFDFIEAEAEICGSDWRSWRNWRGDDSIDVFFFHRTDIACRIRELAHRDYLAIAVLDALAAEDTEDLRQAEVARANPFYPSVA
jgi:hypothetical protein